MRRVFQKLFGGDRRPAVSDRDRFRQLMTVIASTHEDEMNCDECFEMLGRFAELAMSGAPASEVLPLVQDHLDRCPACREEYEALLAALKGVS